MCDEEMEEEMEMEEDSSSTVTMTEAHGTFTANLGHGRRYGY